MSQYSILVASIQKRIKAVWYFNILSGVKSLIIIIIIYDDFLKSDVILVKKGMTEYIKINKDGFRNLYLKY